LTLAAKAATNFAALTARLEAAPFQNKNEIRVFPQPVKACPDTSLAPDFAGVMSAMPSIVPSRTSYFANDAKGGKGYGLSAKKFRNI
jgi:hypothetical protein